MEMNAIFGAQPAVSMPINANMSILKKTKESIKNLGTNKIFLYSKINHYRCLEFVENSLKIICKSNLSQIIL
jgi:hypothetical protein